MSCKCISMSSWRAQGMHACSTFAPLLSPPSLYACLQDRGVISSGAYQPSLGNCFQVLSLQQGSLRPLCVLTAPTPIQEDVHWHHQQAAEAELFERIGARTREPSQQHSNCRVTRQLSGKYDADLSPIKNRRNSACPCPCLLEFGLTSQKKARANPRHPGIPLCLHTETPEQQISAVNLWGQWEKGDFTSAGRDRCAHPRWTASS